VLRRRRDGDGGLQRSFLLCLGDGLWLRRLLLLLLDLLMMLRLLLLLLLMCLFGVLLLLLLLLLLVCLFSVLLSVLLLLLLLRVLLLLKCGRHGLSPLLLLHELLYLGMGWRRMRVLELGD
jgi:hypothetical protein